MLTTDEQAVSENPTVVFSKKEPSEIVVMLTERGYTEAVIIGGYNDDEYIYRSRTGE